MYVQSFKDLIVWQRSMQLVKLVYKLTHDLPSHELYGLSSQLRRAAISVPSNIAEGKKRKSRKEFVQFLRIAEGSAAEIETQLLIILDEYPSLPIQGAQQILSEVQKMLVSMVRTLEGSKS